MNVFEVRVLREGDADSYLAFRRQSLADAPLALTASPESDLYQSADQVRAFVRRLDGSVILGAFTPTLLGAVGLLRSPHPKLRHKLDLWGMYVRPEGRRQGVAAALVGAAIEHARSLGDVEWIHLAAGMPEALRLYERFGFRVWGIERDALRHGGHSIEEHHMALRL